MGQKVNPICLLLGINRTWDTRGYANKGESGKLLHEDKKIREALQKQLKQAAVSKIVIERPHKKCRVTIHSARPGVVIGKKGADIEKLRKEVAKLTDSDVVINIIEIRVALGAGDGAVQRLLHGLVDALARKLEVGERARNLLATDELRDEVQLLRADADVARDSLRFVVRKRTGR